MGFNILLQGISRFLYLEVKQILHYRLQLVTLNRKQLDKIKDILHLTRDMNSQGYP